MDTSQELTERLWEELTYLRERYAVDRLGICGSFICQEQTDESDVDLLVTSSETPDLLEFVNLKRYLEKVPDRPVDLGMPTAPRRGLPPPMFARRSSTCSAEPAAVRSGHPRGNRIRGGLSRWGPL